MSVWICDNEQMIDKNFNESDEPSLNYVMSKTMSTEVIGLKLHISHLWLLIIYILSLW